MALDILFVASKYHPYLGGVETQMRLVAQDLADRHRVAVATPLDDGESFLDGSIAVHGLKLSTFDRRLMLLRRFVPTLHRKIRSRVDYQLFRWVYLPKLRRLVRGKDVVHALKTGGLSRVAEEAARLEGVPFAITPYFHPRDDARAARKQRIEAAFCNRADAVFALLETDRDMLIQLGVAKERIRLAGVMPLLPEKSDPAGFRARHGLGEKPFVLFLGRMVEYKGFKTILDAAAQVWRALPDVHFIFAGPGDETAQRRFAERPDPRIRYLGAVDEDEKGNALAACDLFCMPSTAEILPAVYLEAWTYGKAVIGGSAHGLHELIEGHGAGVTVKQDPEVLAARLVELLRDGRHRGEMGQNGRDLVTRRFSKPALVQAFEQAYEALRTQKTDEALKARRLDATQISASQPSVA